MSNNSEKHTINNLVQRLTELRIQKEKIAIEEDAIHTDLLFLSSYHVPKKPATSRRESITDREGTIIQIGDTVAFLAPTNSKANPVL